MKKIRNTIALCLFSFTAFSQWELIPSGIESGLIDVFFYDDQIGYAVGDSGIILKSANGGLTWTITHQDHQMEFTSVYFLTESTGFVTSMEGVLYKTTDNGTTLIPSVEDFTDAFYDVNFHNDSIGYIGTGKGIYNTQNAGNTWGFTLFNQKTRSIGITNSGLVYFTGNPSPTGVLIKTSDHGQTYQTEVLPFSTVKEKIQFVNDSAGFICGWYGGYLLKTQDNGNSWETVCNCQCKDSYFFDENTGYYIGSNLGDRIIYHTQNGGQTWEPELAVGLVNEKGFSELFFLSNSIGIAVGSDGGIYRMDKSDLGITETNQINFQVFPNPVKGILTIHQTPSTQSILTLRDSKGVIVHSGAFSETMIELELSQLSEGVYFLSNENSQGSNTRKIIKTE